MIEQLKLSVPLSAFEFSDVDSVAQSSKMPKIRRFQVNNAYPKDKAFGNKGVNDRLNLHQCHQCFLPEILIELIRGPEEDGYCSDKKQINDCLALHNRIWFLLE